MGADMHTKYNYSGGLGIGVRVHEPSVDGQFKSDDFQGLFADYLRLCCRHAGMPGLLDISTSMLEHRMPAQVEHIERDTRYLTKGLLRFQQGPETCASCSRG